jgi:hypothetical protein
MNRPVVWRNHLPGLVLLLAVAGVLWLGSPWPPPVADGWDARGRAIHWQWTPANLGVAITIWLVWFAMDGLWAMVERTRRVFNPLSLVDEGILGWVLIRTAGHAVAGGAAPGLQTAAWALAVLALGAAVVLEVRRLGEPVEESPRGVAEDTTALTRDIEHARTSGDRWSYWSVQKAPHRLLFGALGASFLAGAALLGDGPVLARVLLLLAGVTVLLVCVGGLRTVVTPRRLVLRAGGFGPALLRVDTRDIVAVGVPEFDPMSDFGGIGIKRGLRGPLAGVLAFNLAGAGVLVETRAGKRYLIGAYDPDRLAAALDAARGKA